MELPMVGMWLDFKLHEDGTVYYAILLFWWGPFPNFYYVKKQNQHMTWQDLACKFNFFMNRLQK